MGETGSPDVERQTLDKILSGQLRLYLDPPSTDGYIETVVHFDTDLSQTSKISLEKLKEFPWRHAQLGSPYVGEFILLELWHPWYGDGCHIYFEVQDKAHVGVTVGNEACKEILQEWTAQTQMSTRLWPSPRYRHKKVLDPFLDIISSFSRQTW